MRDASLSRRAGRASRPASPPAPRWSRTIMRASARIIRLGGCGRLAARPPAPRSVPDVPPPQRALRSRLGRATSSLRRRTAEIGGRRMIVLRRAREHASTKVQRRCSTANGIVVDPDRPEIRVAGASDAVKLQRRMGRIELEVEGGGLDRLHLNIGELPHRSREGAGHPEIHGAHPSTSDMPHAGLCTSKPPACRASCGARCRRRSRPRCSGPPRRRSGRARG
jgi:hypothetical protein